MSKAKHPSPYRKGSKYDRIFRNFRALSSKNGSVTRQRLIDDEIKAGSSEAAAKAAVGVVLSPTATSDKGDCRGNMSAQGHIYFADRKASGKSKRIFRYTLRWRETPLEPLNRPKKATKTEIPEVEAKTVDPVEAEETAETEETAEA